MKAILKQTSWLFFAQGLSRGVAFFYTIFLARNLGVYDFGLLSVALAYFSIISSVADFGFNRFLIREVAREKSKVAELLGHVTFLRLLLTSVFFAIFSVILYGLDADKMRVSLVLLATLAILPQAIALSFDAIFIAMQNLRYSAISFFISSLTTSLAGIFLVGNGFGPMGAVAALIIGQTIYLLTLIFFLHSKGVLKFTKINKVILKQTMVGSLPYGMLGILGLLYFRIDTILLSYIKGSFETGIYSAAYRFFEAVGFIPAAFQAALFPVFVRSSADLQSRKLFYKSLKILGSLGIVIMLAYIFILPSVIEFFLPNYLPSIAVIIILALAIPFMLANAAAVSLLLSTEKYLKSVILLSFFTVFINIFLNLLFIPIYGFLAAAWVTVFSEILSFIIFFLLTKFKAFK